MKLAYKIEPIPSVLNRYIYRISVLIDGKDEILVWYEKDLDKALSEIKYRIKYD